MVGKIGIDDYYNDMLPAEAGRSKDDIAVIPDTGAGTTSKSSQFACPRKDNQRGVLKEDEKLTEAESESKERFEKKLTETEIEQTRDPIGIHKDMQKYNLSEDSEESEGGESEESRKKKKGKKGKGEESRKGSPFSEESESESEDSEESRRRRRHRSEESEDSEESDESEESRRRHKSEDSEESRKRKHRSGESESDHDRYETVRCPKCGHEMSPGHPGKSSALTDRVRELEDENYAIKTALSSATNKIKAIEMEQKKEIIADIMSMDKEQDEKILMSMSRNSLKVLSDSLGRFTDNKEGGLKFDAGSSNGAGPTGVGRTVGGFNVNSNKWDI